MKTRRREERGEIETREEAGEEADKRFIMSMSQGKGCVVTFSHLFCRAMGSDREPDSSVSCKPFMDSLQRARNIRNASLCIIEGKAIDVVPAWTGSPVTVASSVAATAMGLTVCPFSMFSVMFLSPLTASSTVLIM
jgi:hypothetical protein